MKRHSAFYLAGLISSVTFAVYLPALQNDFVNWDDRLYVVNNLHIRSFDLTLFRWAFLDYYAGNWHPLTWISHALDYALWGLNPLGHHLTNNILHTVNSFIVVMLTVTVVKIWRQRTALNEIPAFPDERGVLIIAGVTGLLFGIHPIHVESVAWVAERKDLLCALFFLLGIMAYMGFVSHRSYKAYLLSLGFFVLAVLSKPMAVTLPAVLLMLDWYPLRRVQSMKSWLHALVEKLPFIMLSLISVLLTILAQRRSGAMWAIPAPLSVRTLAAARALIAYLYNMVIPLNLVPIYPYPMGISFKSIGLVLPLILVAGISVSCIIKAKKEKLWLAAWCYYLITLLPVLGIVVQVGIQLMADRYTYLPSLGPFLIVGVGTAWLTSKIRAVRKHGMICRVFGVAATLVVLLFMTWLTVLQIGIWKNGIRLWSYVIEKEGEKVPTSYLNRGELFYEQGGQLDKALGDFDRVIALTPSNLSVYVDPSYYYAAYLKRASVFDKMGQLQKAIADYDSAIALHPSFEAYNNKGGLYGQHGMLDEAIEQFTRAIEINPNASLAYGNRAHAYSLTGQRDRALEDFDKAIALDYKYAEAYIGRGNLFLETGKRELAVSDFQKACELGNKEGCDLSKLNVR